MVTRILHKPEYSVDQTIAAYDEILDEMKEKGITGDELEPIKVKFRSNYFSMLEGGHGASIPRYGLMHLLACFSLFDNEPQLVNSILDGFMEVPAEAVQSVAQKLFTRHNRSIAIRQPAKKGADLMASVPRSETPSTIPALTTARPVIWPARVHKTLSNGLEIVLVESHTIPKFTGELFFRSGNAVVAAQAPGLADMTATVARTGTTRRTSRQIEEDLRRMGADLSSGAGADNSVISFAGLVDFSNESTGPRVGVGAARLVSCR